MTQLDERIILAGLSPALRQRIEPWRPRSSLGGLIRDCLHYLPAELAEELLERVRSCLIIESSLELLHVHGPQASRPGRIDDYGVVSRRLITDAGVAAVGAAFVGTFEAETFNYHGIGTGNNPEAVADTALQIELTTEYATDNVRPSGTRSAPTPSQYRSVASNTPGASVSIVEHGLFSQSAAPGGTLLDRSVFGAVVMVAGDTLTSTYTLSLANDA